MVGRHHGERDADVFAAAEMVLRIEQAEGEAKQRRLGRQGNVALVPGEPDAHRLLAVVPTSRDHADVAHGGRIGAGEGTGERKAGDLLAAGEPGQVVRLLRVGAVFLDQLARTERVRHHDDGDAVGAARGDLAEDERLRLGREAQAPMLLGDEHAEKALLADEAPDVVGDVVQLVADAPVVEPAAELLGGPVEKGALLRCKLDRRHAAKL